jgi:poly(3-hydroxybutyrate) depolymerase
MKNSLPIAVLFLVCLGMIGCGSQKSRPIEELTQWLSHLQKERPALSNQAFATQPLQKEEVGVVKELLLVDKQKRLSHKYGEQWERRELRSGSYSMPFYYKVWGDEPADGRSLFISMHGGGGAPAAVNDQQYKNQQHLYDATMEKMEGVYLAPRAPTDTWNLWHQAHIDSLFNVLIQMAVIKENVNPNKVFLLGYSAGGDGVYQLAPRLADRLAAASMMAGHPNDASAKGLRNLPFTIHMGELDAAYKRNEIACEWKEKLSNLQNSDNGGYIHSVNIHPGKGHWMQRQDSVALPWMQQYERNPWPEKIVWLQSGVVHTQFYWLAVTANEAIKGNEAEVSYNKSKNEVIIHQNDYTSLTIYLNDEMINLDEAVNVYYGSNLLFSGKIDRTIKNLIESMEYRGDPYLAFPVKLQVKDNKTVSVEKSVV